MQEAVLQDRYALKKEAMQSYIEEQVSLGYVTTGEVFYQTSFIVYNVNNEETILVQNTWYNHIQQVGIQCMISFYFVAQRFPNIIKEFVEDWNFGRKKIQIM